MKLVRTAIFTIFALLLIVGFATAVTVVQTGEQTYKISGIQAGQPVEVSLHGVMQTSPGIPFRVTTGAFRTPFWIQPLLIRASTSGVRSGTYAIDKYYDHSPVHAQLRGNLFDARPMRQYNGWRWTTDGQYWITFEGIPSSDTVTFDVVMTGEIKDAKSGTGQFTFPSFHGYQGTVQATVRIDGVEYIKKTLPVSTTLQPVPTPTPTPTPIPTPSPLDLVRARSSSTPSRSQIVASLRTT